MKKDFPRKDILNKVILKLKSEKNGYFRVDHKESWLNFLETGDLVFTPYELHEILKKVIKEFPPNGDKLFYLRKRRNFHVEDKKACRPEEALERFITVSNPGNFFNQIPIGGKKESIDIGIKEENESRFVFIELKPWQSNNSPLYAIVESLKNLIEYRAIQNDERKAIKRHKYFKDYDEKVDLIVLAPKSYYVDHGMIDKSKGQYLQDKISIVRKVLNDFSSEFRTNISLMILPIDKKHFDDECSKVCSKYKKTEGKQNIVISNDDFIPILAKDKWELLVSSDKK